MAGGGASDGVEEARLSALARQGEVHAGLVSCWLALWQVGSRGLRGEGRAGQLPMPVLRNGSVGSRSDGGPAFAFEQSCMKWLAEPTYIAESQGRAGG